MSRLDFAALDEARKRQRPLSGSTVLIAGQNLARLIDIDPIVLAWRKRPDGPLTTPEDVLAHRNEVALDVLEGRTGYGTWGEYADRVPLAYQVYSAIPFLWQPEMVRASQEGHLPPHVIGREQFPHPVMWWVVPQIQIAADAPDEWGFEAALLIDHGTYFRAVMFLANAIEERRIDSVKVDYGSHFPGDFRDPEAHGTYLKMLSFMNSPFIPKVTARVTRQERRRAERQGWEERDADKVRFIDLRAAERLATGKAIGEVTGVEWHHRWIVRGHHRAQWYPTIQAHKVIWVAPYVKGPDGLPLKIPAYNVNR